MPFTRLRKRQKSARQPSSGHKRQPDHQQQHWQGTTGPRRRPSCIFSALLVLAGYLLGHLDYDCSIENTVVTQECKSCAHPFFSLLTPHEDELLENPGRKMKRIQTNKPNGTSATVMGTGNTAPNYHIIFSTGCTPNQEWQSYLLFYSAMRVKQPGRVTRIVSGCKTQLDRTHVQSHFDQHIVGMSQRFRLHFMASSVADVIVRQSSASLNVSVLETYKFFNKPFGVQDWLKETFVNNYTNDERDHEADKDIIILIDPDMILLKPLIPPSPVRTGQPVAQRYGYEDDWITQVPNVTTIVGTDSPAFTKYNATQARTLFSAGPPYMFTRRDMNKIVDKWCELVPQVHELHPKLLAEMYAYSLAAAHLELPHVLLPNFMVSTSGQGSESEGWLSVDDGLLKDYANIPQGKVCETLTAPPENLQSLPFIFHYCQVYVLGPDLFFYKGFLPPTFFHDCQHGLQVEEEPPYLLDAMANGTVKLNGKGKNLSPLMIRRNAFMLCTMTRHVNDAATFLKERICNVGEANYDLSSKMVNPWDKW